MNVHRDTCAELKCYKPCLEANVNSVLKQIEVTNLVLKQSLVKKPCVEAKFSDKPCVEAKFSD